MRECTDRSCACVSVCVGQGFSQQQQCGDVAVEERVGAGPRGVVDERGE